MLANIGELWEEVQRTDIIPRNVYIKARALMLDENDNIRYGWHMYRIVWIGHGGDDHYCSIGLEIDGAVGRRGEFHFSTQIFHKGRIS